jgi:hypothetical protein
MSLGAGAGPANQRLAGSLEQFRAQTSVLVRALSVRPPPRAERRSREQSARSVRTIKSRIIREESPARRRRAGA